MGLSPDLQMDSSPSESFSASRWTHGNFLFPTRLVVEHRHVESGIGTYFDRRVLVGDPNRIQRRNRSHHQPGSPQS